MATVKTTDLRITAFDLTEYVLYVYATVWFIVRAIALRGAGINQVQIISIGLGMVFVAVLIRSYLVLHHIDYRRDMEFGKYLFVSHFGPFSSFLERFVRFAMILVVIVTPKGMFTFITDFVNGISDVIYARGHFEIYQLHTREDRFASHDQAIHPLLQYYAIVLFSIFALFLIWDIIAAGTVRRLVTRHEIQADVDFLTPAVSNPVYRSTLRYFNVCRERDPLDNAPADAIEFTSFGSYHGANRQRLLAGDAVGIYFHSPKLRERAYGLLTSALIFVCSAMEFNIVSVCLLGAFAALYVDNVRLNEKYVRSMIYFLLFSLTYFIQPSSVQAAVGISDRDL